MTDKEIQQACLDAYTDALKNLPSNFKDALNYLDKRNLEVGVCLYSIIELGVSIKDSYWVKESSLFNSAYWYIPPHMCYTTQEIKESLQFRIEKLKELLAE